jgi:hypothetical protein
MIYALKGGGWPSFHYLCAQKLWLGSEAAPFAGSENRVVMASPPQVVGQVDHSGELARQVSRVSHWPLVHGLKRVEQSKGQKGLDRVERTKVHLEWTGEAPESVIFVDDVITTGATASAAWRALGKPMDFQVWCLVERALLPS